MKLKNKKTGDIGYLCEHSLIQDIIIVYDVKGIVGKYNSLAELNEEWEDIPEEPIQVHIEGIQRVYMDGCGRVFIDYATAEEAELAVRKLKAWKRLKDKGFRFERWGIGGEYGNTITFSDYIEYNDETRADLDLLFGGEE